MGIILARASRNFLLHHPWQLGLAILGIALGVAVVVSIDLARISAQQAFERSTETVFGKATHRVTGGPAGLDEAIYPLLRVQQGLEATAVIDSYVRVENDSGRPLRLLGIDPLAPSSFGGNWRLPAQGDSGNTGVNTLVRLMAEPDTMLLTEPTALRLGIVPGDTLAVLAGTKRREIRLVGWFKAVDAVARQGLADVIVTDIASAQELLGMTGKLSHIDLVLKPGPAEKNQLDRIKASLPLGVRLTLSGARVESVEQMTKAFYTNLTALSLLALLVGTFLVYNTITFMVVRRRPLIGSLRTLGVTSREIFRLVIAEALLIGMIGTVLGIIFGIGLAHFVLELVTRTINDLYFVLAVTKLSYSPAALGKGIILGFGANLIAAIASAREATKVTPRLALTRSHLESRTRHLVARAALVGITAITIGMGIIMVSGKSIVLGFACLFLITIGCTLLTPAMAVVLMALLQAVPRVGVLGRVPTRALTAALSRTAVAIGALMIAIATTIGVGLMIHSLRLSVANWLESIMQADVYVSASGPTLSGSSAVLEDKLVRRIAALPDVAAISTARRLRIEAADSLVELVAYGLASQSYEGFRFKHGQPLNIWYAFEHESAVIVSESYAYHQDLKLGSKVRLPTDQGEHEFPVVGIYYDYSSDRGVIAMSRKTFDLHWNVPGYSSISIYAEDDTNIDRFNDAIKGVAQGRALRVISNRSLREASLQVFDQTFTITQVLRWLAAIIAFVGVFSSLMALQLERTQELGILRAIGVTPAQLWGLILSETGLMGLVAGVLGVPVGTLLAALLVFVINRRSFGWTMDFHIAPNILTNGLILAVIAALLAGIYPALKMARTHPAKALQAE